MYIYTQYTNTHTLIHRHTHTHTLIHRHTDIHKHTTTHTFTYRHTSTQTYTYIYKETYITDADVEIGLLAQEKRIDRLRSLCLQRLNKREEKYCATDGAIFWLQRLQTGGEILCNG